MTGWARGRRERGRHRGVRWRPWERTGTVQGPQRGQRAQSRGCMLERLEDKAGPRHRGAKGWAVGKTGLKLRLEGRLF